MRYPATIVLIFITTLIAAQASARHGGPHGPGMGGPHRGGAPTAAGESAYFAPPENCAFCHNPLWDAGGNDVSLYDDWGATMMSQAARDPLWQAKVASEVLRNPKIGLALQERCGRCHTPMAENEARFSFQQLHLLNGGFLDPQHRLFDLAAGGVSCTVCHQIRASKLGTHESFSGGYVIDSITARPDRAIFGPYPRPVQMPMRMHSGFTPLHGDQVKKSELCASCHTLYIPVTDGQGKIIGESPEQAPYLEWQHSIYGDNRDGDDVSCQQCHMPPADGAVIISRMPHHLGARAPFGKHHFVGGNTLVLKMIRDAWQELAPDEPRPSFDKTIARAQHQLQHNAADVRIQGIRSTGDGLEVSVEVANLTGHKLPTGIPIRRLWLHLTVKDADGAAVFESGRPGPEGAIQGNAADADPNLFEPHYEVVTRADQVQIYETILGNSDGQPTYALSRGIEHLKENRLLPIGFDKMKASSAVRTHGAASTDADFSGGSDTTLYRIPTAGAALPLTIEVELLYQTAGFAFLQDLLRFKDRSPIIERFSRQYARADKTPVRLGRARMTHAPR